ncbi:glycosyltransferase family 9 protein [Pantoea allii]|uniref:glycosyltransferase family 9 protein n=1 Tax=Pantoea allii TaxID=574096 RepID=UPI003D31F13C
MKNILVIRRDNIGDMVCTTPLLEGIKTAFPEAKLTLLVNKVAQDVILHNPHVDALHVYKKAKHRGKNETAIGVYWHRLKIFWALRKTKFDAAVLANPVPCKYSLRLARMAGATHIIGAGEASNGLTRIFCRDDFSGNHQVEHTYSYLSALTDRLPAVPPVRVYLTHKEREQAKKRVNSMFSVAGQTYGIHISSRSPKRRWGLESYAAFIHYLLEDEQARVLIFWSPQGALGPDDRGDDARAESLLELINSSRVAAYSTTSVRDLMAGFSCCDQILCSDGGQMHIAAGLHKKQVVFFGDTDAPGWHPWSGEYKILQTPSGECNDVTLESVIDAWQQLKGSPEAVVA